MPTIIVEKVVIDQRRWDFGSKIIKISLNHDFVCFIIMHCYITVYFKWNDSHALVK